MILDHNTTSKVAYNSTGTNIEMNEVKTTLTSDTEKWKDKARLIKSDEIAKITGNTVFNSKTTTSSGYFNLETNTTTAPSTFSGKYAWLYDYTHECTSYGCDIADNNINGYWTESKVYGDDYLAWVIQYVGNVGLGNIKTNNKYGIRPVISISKKDINVYKEEILNGADPIYSNNLIPVTIADNGTVTKASIYSKWYSYEDKKWANAVILSDETKKYRDGEIIPEANIESYFVWIPRYKYKLFNTGNYTTYSGTTKPTTSIAQEIEIVFETKDTSLSNGTKVGEYLTHPAFISFDTNGLWIGKFETGYKGATIATEAEITNSDSTKIIIKPNVYSWRSNTIKNIFESSYNYKRNNESHLIKNTEWGAAALLSHSKYGINQEVVRNNNSAYLTGFGAVNEATVAYMGYSLSTNEFGTDVTITQPYNTSIGYKASTTGNITGIYDMSGGAHEYTASYIDENLGSSGFTSDPTLIYGTKYFDKYSSTSTLYNYSNRILGDATGEIGPFYYYLDNDRTNRSHNSWYGDYSAFIESSNPWFHRGCQFEHGISTGVFSFSGYSGGTYFRIGSRIVLTK